MTDAAATDLRRVASRRFTNVIDPGDASKRITVMSRPTPQGYYVIIGRGPAAVVNHTTLRQSVWGSSRLGGVPVLHIGFEDPWTHYKDHLMGQFPNLLGLPGFTSQPNTATSNSCAPERSQSFADRTTAEMARLASKCFVVPGWVAFIQPQGMPPPPLLALTTEGVDVAPLSDSYPSNFPPYRLLVVDTAGKSWLCYAEMIDICTGSGRPRITPSLNSHRSSPWSPPETWPSGQPWRPISSGTEALYREAVWASDARVCVMGSAGVAVNVVERAEEDATWVDWLAQTTLHLASFFNERNDHLLKHPWENKRPGNRMTMGQFSGRTNPRTTIDPALDTWRFGGGSDVDQIYIVGSKGRPVFLQSSAAAKETPPRQPSIRDYWESDQSLSASPAHFAYSSAFLGGHAFAPSADLYDHVIFCRGQDPGEIGHPAQLTSALGPLNPILASTDQRLVGLQSIDGRVRVLGVAAIVNRSMLPPPSHPTMVAADEYQNSLPAQARFPGHTLGCANVAMANEFFLIKPNTNVNTMSPRELEVFLGNAYLADEVIRARVRMPFGVRNRDELEHQLRSRPSADLPPDWRTRMSGLRYGY